jgi:hypothetical protein
MFKFFRNLVRKKRYIYKNDEKSQTGLVENIDTMCRESFKMLIDKLTLGSNLALDEKKAISMSKHIDSTVGVARDAIIAKVCNEVDNFLNDNKNEQPTREIHTDTKGEQSAEDNTDS